MSFWNNVLSDLHQASPIISAIPVVGTTINVATSVASNPSINPNASPSTDPVGQALTTANQTVDTTVSDTAVKVVKSKQARNTAKVALTHVSPGLSLAYDLATSNPSSTLLSGSTDNNTPLDSGLQSSNGASSNNNTLFILVGVGVLAYLMFS